MSEFSFFEKPSAGPTANFGILKAGAKAAVKAPGSGFWGKAAPIMEAAGLATLPLSLAPLVVKSADTRALETMRNEDRIRKNRGFDTLPMTDGIQTKINALR